MPSTSTAARKNPDTTFATRRIESATFSPSRTFWTPGRCACRILSDRTRTSSGRRGVISKACGSGFEGIDSTSSGLRFRMMSSASCLETNLTLRTSGRPVR